MEKPFISAYTNTAELKKDSKNLFHTWFSKTKILEENSELEKRIAILEVDAMRTEYLESVLEKSNILHTIDSKIISTSILRKNNSGIITVLGGKDYTFSVGDSVIHFDGTLIGNISAVFDATSQVSLFTKNNVKTSGILFPQNVSIELVGNGNAMLAELNRDIDVNIGDIIYSQGNTGHIIGTVSNVDFDPRDPVKKVYISPIQSILSLQQIGIKKTTIE
ncbi:MAG: hypothetical protein LR005_01320 [Candidatus Pacebacteria bacterium]|nr:hypothetical protein [Candidatus Paceibacterota bacterium]